MTFVTQQETYFWQKKTKKRRWNSSLSESVLSEDLLEICSSVLVDRSRKLDVELHV